MNVRCLVNGTAAAGIDAGDRGLQFGDGLFETMALIDGRVRRLERHLERLKLGCGRLGIPYPGEDTLEGDLAQLRNPQGRAVLKLIVTRGVGARGYSAPATSPTRILTMHSWPDHPNEWAAEGVAIRLCRIEVSDQPALAGLKHLNRLEQVLARREWTDPEIAEGLLCDARGHVVCGTMSNVFLVLEGQLVTPRLDRSGVAGTVRAWVREWASSNSLPCLETEISRDDLRRADEVFLTNALIGAWPVRRLDERRWAVGPVTRRLLAALD